MSEFELFVGAFAGVAVGKSKKAIALFIVVQMGFVNDADCPHESVIEATAKAATASHLHLLSSTCLIEGEPAG